ncbi:MAG: YggS family pyridoxal phosphate-dependent enzyme [Candidatus Cloacimonetes bacterium]|nr:YggS family pyridoxal phosphate-dependent enzyme [Candidatus Cloacimonadota bacterium]
MDIKERIDEVKERLCQVAKRSGRDADYIRLLAVTKTQPVEIIKEALATGLEFIGENKVQEAADKIPYLEGLYREFHFIGHLQSNKVKKLLSLQPALIHSVDSLHLAQKIDEEAAKLDIIQEILLQVNTSGEASKYGVTPAEAKSLALAVGKLAHIKMSGLMSIGRFTGHEGEIRSSFRELMKIGSELQKEEELEIKWYSMGMSNDFEIAIEEGANLLRLGTAIFGSRPKDEKCQIR